MQIDRVYENVGILTTRKPNDDKRLKNGAPAHKGFYMSLCTGDSIRVSFATTSHVHCI